jgi:hypothetical protein
MTARRADRAPRALALPALAALFLGVAGLAASPVAWAANGEPANDFPTEARADYVFACMAANGQTREALRKCSCAVDVLASIMPYDKYVESETILSMRLGVGQAANVFRNTPRYDDVVADLRRAQAEAEMRCF